MQTTLAINGLELKVNLGATLKERSKKQTVLLNIDILFPALPRACLTDKIEDTLCYATLITAIRKFCSGKEYVLIEHLSHQLYGFVKKNIPKKCHLFLEIEKKPPIKGIHSCSFIIED